MAKKKNTTRKDGLIAVQVYLGLDENGKRKYKTVYGRTQPEADAKAEQVKISMRKGLDVTAEKETFELWSERWLEVKKAEVSLSQYNSYRGSLKHLVLSFGNIALKKIKTADIQSVLFTLAEMNPNTQKPSSKKTLKHIRLIAQQIFRLAIENRVLDYNPVLAVRIPGNAPQDKCRALTDEEQHWILDSEHRAKRAAMIMMYAGLRRGELIALTWNDIDLEKRTINVNKTAEKASNQFIIKNSTKTYAGMRVVDIPNVLADYLRSESRDGIHVCLSIQGKMHTESSWKRMWNSYLTELNFKHGNFSLFSKKPKSKYDNGGVPFMIPRITPHWLRHTYATMLYFAGVDVLTAKEQLGHADAQTTLGIYTHLDKTHKRKAMSKLDEYLNNVG
ncbi:MAG: site-specific integrase [Oscillospiraceae bacterium]|nr:site-specific integrase [Oscillospiraceae bacterium]